MQARDYDHVKDPSLLRFLVDMRGADTEDKQLRDDLMTLLIAGHETTAAALTWGFYSLAQAPQALQELQDEVDSVVGDHRPTWEDIKRMPCLRNVRFVLLDTKLRVSVLFLLPFHTRFLSRAPHGLISAWALTYVKLDRQPQVLRPVLPHALASCSVLSDVGGADCGRVPADVPTAPCAHSAIIRGGDSASGLHGTEGWRHPAAWM